MANELVIIKRLQILSTNTFYQQLKASTQKNNQNDSSVNNMDSTMPIHYLLQSFKSSFPNTELKLLSTREVKKNYHKSLKLNNSQGYDEVSIKLLKISSLFIISPQTQNVINHYHQEFSRPFKILRNKHLFKKGEKQNISKYRHHVYQS